MKIFSSNAITSCQFLGNLVLLYGKSNLTKINFFRVKFYFLVKISSVPEVDSSAKCSTRLFNDFVFGILCPTVKFCKFFEFTPLNKFKYFRMSSCQYNACVIEQNYQKSVFISRFALVCYHIISPEINEFLFQFSIFQLRQGQSQCTDTECVDCE